LSQLGVDIVISHPFDPETVQLSPLEFMAIVNAHLGLQRLLVGHDFALGRNRAGNPDVLRQIGQKFGYTVEEFPPFTVEGQVVSSSRIRSALLDGDVAAASALLGRPYSLTGRVEHGDGRGKPLGIPTANLEVWADRVIPKSGVYACQVAYQGKTWGAVTNVGVRPTFADQLPAPRVEAHLLDFDQDLYGQELRLSFLARLRDEQRFPNVAALVAQIQADIEQGRRLLSTL
jgi:riboflavin kinase/FMN adenylyltransferase